MKDSLKNLLEMFPYFFDKKTISNFYKSQSVSNARFQDIFQSLFDTIESFRLDKKILIWKEQSERFEYVIHFVANFENIKTVTLYKNDSVIYSNSYTFDENVNSFNYSYSYSTVNDVENIELADIIPQDTFKAIVETYNEFTIIKGFPENDNIQGNEYDHDESLDEIGALNNIPRKEYILVDEELYPITEPPFNDRLTEDDYHYMRRMLEYNIRLHTTPAPVLEIWKLYGIDAIMENREKLLLKVFDMERHPNFKDPNAPGDGWFSGTLEEDGTISEWTPHTWEHLDKFCDYEGNLGQYFFVTTSTKVPVVNQNITFYFSFLNRFAEKISGDFLVDVSLDGSVIVSNCTADYFEIQAENLSINEENVFIITGKTSTGEVIGIERIKVNVRGCDDADFYVSENGSDSNDGKTRATAFATIQKAINAVNGNQSSIALLSGNYEIISPVLVNMSCTILGCGECVIENTEQNVFFTISPNVSLSLQNITLSSETICEVDNVSYTNKNGDNTVSEVIIS